jgi:hypothetical protein
MTPKEIADLKLECLKLAMNYSNGKVPFEKAKTEADKIYHYITKG